MKTLVLGLGNPLLGDDGVGWRVAEEVAKALRSWGGCSASTPPPEVDFHGGGGLSLMERLVGYDRAILIDAMNLGQAPVGTVTSLLLEDVQDPFAGHLASTHETTLRTALEMGKSMGVALPQDIIIVAVESPHVYEITDKLSEPVTAAVPLAVQKVIERLTN